VEGVCDSLVCVCYDKEQSRREQETCAARYAAGACNSRK
jgi:hypothetical protein